MRMDEHRQSRGIHIASLDNVNRTSSFYSVRVRMMFSSVILSVGLPLCASSSRRVFPSQNCFVYLLTANSSEQCLPFVSLSIHMISATFSSLAAKNWIHPLSGVYTFTVGIQKEIIGRQIKAVQNDFDVVTVEELLDTSSEMNSAIVRVDFPVTTAVRRMFSRNVLVHQLLQNFQKIIPVYFCLW